jgi:hypothetical protein
VLVKGKAAPDLLLELHAFMFSEPKRHVDNVLSFFKKWRYHFWILDESNGKLLRPYDGVALTGRVFLVASQDESRFAQGH